MNTIMVLLQHKSKVYHDIKQILNYPKYISDALGLYAQENARTVQLMTLNVDSSDMGEQRYKKYLKINENYIYF